MHGEIVSSEKQVACARRFAYSARHDPSRRGAGVVERGGLENRCGCKPTQGSNPCLSAKYIYKYMFYKYFSEDPSIYPPKNLLL